jgi:hypothetical protein
MVPCKGRTNDTRNKLLLIRADVSFLYVQGVWNFPITRRESWGIELGQSICHAGFKPLEMWLCGTNKYTLVH